MNRSLSAAMADLARDLHADDDVENIVNTVIRHIQTIAPRRHACVVLGNEESAQVAAASDAEAHEADTLQIKLGEGASLTAMTTSGPVRADSLSAETRWRRWAPAASELGLASVLSVRMHHDTQTLGTLTLYSRRAHHFSPADAEAVELYARHASMALVSAQRFAALRRAIENRNLVGQAQGILVERHGIDAGDALSMLRRYAQQRETGLADVASEVIASLDVNEHDDAASHHSCA